MKETLYFSHDSDARHDLKIKALIKKYGMRGYGVFWVIIELMRSQENYLLPLKTYVIEGIADETHESVEFINEYVDYCTRVLELFKTDGAAIWSDSFLNRMEKKDMIIEQRRMAGIASGKKRRRTEEDINTSSTDVEEIRTSVEQPLNTCPTINKGNKGNKGNKQIKETKEINDIVKNTIEVETLSERKKRLLEARRDAFWSMLLNHKQKYGDEMILRFFNYWSEANKSGTQMKYEMESTWETERRLQTWQRNDEKFNQKKGYHASDY